MLLKSWILNRSSKIRMLTSLEFDGTTKSVEKTILATTETYPAAPQWVDHYIYWFCPFNKNHSYMLGRNMLRADSPAPAGAEMRWRNGWCHRTAVHPWIELSRSLHHETVLPRAIKITLWVWHWWTHFFRTNALENTSLFCSVKRCGEDDEFDCDGSVFSSLVLLLPCLRQISTVSINWLHPTSHTNFDWGGLQKILRNGRVDDGQQSWITFLDIVACFLKRTDSSI